MLSKISQIEKYVYHLHVESKKAKLTETGNRMVVTKGWGWEKWGDVGQRVQTSS